MKNNLISESIFNISNILTTNGFECYLVGGCVRDFLFGLVPNDYDFCTNAKTNEIIKLFKENNYNVILTGEKHGTVTVVDMKNNSYEITTFRVDGNYTDSRHPDSIKYTNSLKEDLSRRDFSINSIALKILSSNGDYKLYDYFNGINDIKNKILRAVGNPYIRFNEDHLRILRALRFAAKYNLKISNETSNAIKELSSEKYFKSISRERIREEFNKIILSDYFTKVSTEYKEVFADIIPEIRSMLNFNQRSKWHSNDLYTHSMNVVMNSPKNLISRLAAYFHDIGKVKVAKEDSNGNFHFPQHSVISAEIAEKIRSLFSRINSQCLR